MLQTNIQDRIQGKVQWFNEKRGYGLITYNDKDIFAHHSEILVSGNTYKVLIDNEDVEFSVFEMTNNKTNKTKLCAKNITGPNGSKLQCELSNVLSKQKPKKKRRPKNTENFEPCHKESDMNIRVNADSSNSYKHNCTPNDVTVVHNLFCSENDQNIYELLLNEIKNSEVDQNNLWKLWHGDTHLIADDHLDWKNDCPTFNMIIEKIKKYFNMNIKATRLNWYKDSSQWKPFHHDAAAVKPHIAKIQNWTVAVSFGSERDVAFEHSKSKVTISLPQPNGSLYAFGNKVNMEWKHGIPQVLPEKQHNNGRISIIAWGWVNMD